MSENPLGSCWHCGAELGDTDYAREARCPGCQRGTHCCRNCRFYKPGVNNSCSEPVADYVTDKERANFCDYFGPARARADAPADDPAALRAAAEDLFRS